MLREMIIQTLNSNKVRQPNEPQNELAELTKILIQKQEKLTSYLNIGLFYFETKLKL